ncbi:hypothetical protein QJQ45_024298 [Haematococcus lacustris]|nr:hypothetical protein QJQ45_024298 [Haematococcus lacustris]
MALSFCALLWFLAACGTSSAATCPPEKFDSVADFSLAAYIAAPWYVQKQVPVSYQKAEDLNCVRAVYKPVDSTNLKAGLTVFNYANRGAVNGPVDGTSQAQPNQTQLLAVPDPDASGPTAASKLLVGPAFLKTLLAAGAWKAAFGPYWVVAVGPSANKTIAYDWAIITGGAPNTPTENGKCRTGRPGNQAQQYFGGFWLFSRKPVDPAATAIMEAKALELGLDTAQLLAVKQEGCTYLGA